MKLSMMNITQRLLSRGATRRPGPAPVLATPPARKAVVQDQNLAGEAQAYAKMVLDSLDGKPPPDLQLLIINAYAAGGWAAAIRLGHKKDRSLRDRSY